MADGGCEEVEEDRACEEGNILASAEISEEGQEQHVQSFPPLKLMTTLSCLVNQVHSLLL